MTRVGEIARKTAETDIKLRIALDGQGQYRGETGVPFLDHMLTLWCKNAGCDLTLQVQGDLAVDAHHTVEDIGICLGLAVNTALGDKAGVTRYGSALVPMDEALVLAVLDLSGRPFLNFEVNLPAARVGTFETELVVEFLRSFVNNSKVTLHLRQFSGSNTHHIIEAIYKAWGRAWRQAKSLDPLVTGVPSTKGTLS